MKKVSVFLLAVLFMFSFSSASYATNDVFYDDVKRIVIVGYAEDQRTVLFGDKDDNEIEGELETISEDLLSAENVEDIINQKYKDTGLFIKVILPQECREICVEQSYAIEDGAFRGSDEKPISRTFNYRVGFELNAGTGYGYYQTIASGSYNSTTHTGIIDLNTTHTAQLYFSFNDSAPGTNTATTTFTCFIVTYSVVVVTFTATSSGTITIS